MSLEPAIFQPTPHCNYVDLKKRRYLLRCIISYRIIHDYMIQYITITVNRGGQDSRHGRRRIRPDNAPIRLKTREQDCIGQRLGVS